MPQNKATTQSTTSTPWSEAQPALKGAISSAQSLVANKTGFNPYPDSTVVPQSAQTQQALTGIQNTASQGNPLGGQSMSALSSILQGNSNPYWQQAVDNQAGALTDNINQSYSQMGRYGSAAHSGTIADQVGQFRNQALSDNWNSNVANQLNAVNAAPGAYDQQYAPYERMAQVGAAQDDLASRELQDKIQRFTQTDQAPWQRLAAGNAIYSGNGQLGGTTSQSVQQPSNIFGQILGGLSSGAGLLGLLGL